MNLNRSNLLNRLEIRRLIDRFEDTLFAGGSPRIEDALPTDPSDRLFVLEELIHAEIEYFGKRGLPVDLSPYLERFSELCRMPEVVARLRASVAHYVRNLAGSAALASTDATISMPPSDQLEKDRPTDLRLSERFRILRPHARGGLGQVSVALDQELNREVALKEIQPRYADDRTSRERFVAEAEITGGLEHPGIVPIYALGKGRDGRPFYAMRFVRGDSLKDAIDLYHKSDRPGRSDPGVTHLALRKLLGRFIDVCNAMEYAHSRGVIHRDLKPANIMVGKYGETLVVDWGLAKSVDNSTFDQISGETFLRPLSTLSSSGHTQPGSVVGTPAYMSPEQAAGKLTELGPQSDVYSLGATLYQLLCGQPPFGKEGLDQILEKVRCGNFSKPRSIASLLPKSLEAICLKAMSVEAAERYSSARLLADDLEHWLADEPVAAAPDSLSDRIWRFARKHRSYVRAGVLAVLIVAIVSSVAALLINQQRILNRNLASEMESLAKKNARLADDERIARTMTERQLRIAIAERLAALSHAKRFETPGLGLLLAVESGRVTHPDDEGIRQGSHQALLDSLNSIGGVPFSGGEDEFFCVTMSPDSRWLVTGAVNGHVRAWDLLSQNPAANPHLLHGHLSGVFCVAVSSDSRWLISTSKDATARLWDLTSADPAANSLILTGRDSAIYRGVFSPDNRWVVTAGQDDAVRIWDLMSANPASDPRVLTGLGGVVSVAISADSRWLATAGNDGIARVWELSDNQPPSAPRILKGHKANITSVAISPDNQWIVTAGFDNAARIWNFAAKNPAAGSIVIGGQQGLFTDLKISPDSHWLVTSSQNNVPQVWDFKSNNPPAAGRNLIGHQNLVQSTTFSPDSRWVITASRDRTLRFWDRTVESPVANPRVFPGQPVVQLVAISPDGRWVYTASMLDNYACIYDLTRTKPAVERSALVGHQGKLTCLAVSTDNHWLVTGSDDSTARIWNLTADDPAAHPIVLNGHSARINSLAISADNHWIVTGSIDKTARIWNLTSPDPAADSVILSGHEGVINSLAISPDGSRVFTGGIDGARMWDLTANDPAASSRSLGEQRLINCVAISPDGHWLVTAGGDKTACVWDLTLESPSADPQVLSGHHEDVWKIAMSPDSRWLITVSTDNIGRVWDLSARDPAANPLLLTGHQQQISCLTVSPDSRYVATASFDGGVRLWDLTTENPAANPLILLRKNAGVSAIAFSPDGRSVFTWTSPGPLAIWKWQWPDLVDLAEGVGTNFDESDWKLNFPNEPYRQTFSDFVTRVEPLRAMAYVGRGDRFNSNNVFDKAEDDYSEAIRMDSQNVLAFRRRGELFARTRQLEKGIDDLQQAFALSPDDTQLGYVSALLMLYSGNTKGYRAICQSMRDRFSATANNKAAIDLLRARNLEPGMPFDQVLQVELAKRVASINPNTSLTHSVLAGISLRSGQFESALKSLDRSDVLGAESSQQMVNDLLRSLILCHLDQTNEARQLLERARQSFEEHLKPAEGLSFAEISGGRHWDWYAFEILRHEIEERLKEPASNN